MRFLFLKIFVLASTLILQANFASAAADSSSEACPTPLVPVIANSCIVSPGTLWRGAKPDTVGAAALLEKGVRTVVNLELLHDDRDAFSSAKPSLNENTSLDYFRIYEWEPNVVIAPSLLDRHVADFISIMQSAAKPVYVHCRSGQNRTGVMVAAYRILIENMPVEDAIAEMQKYQGIWFKQDEAYLRRLAGKYRTRIEAAISRASGKPKPAARLTCTLNGCAEDH